MATVPLAYGRAPGGTKTVYQACKSRGFLLAFEVPETLDFTGFGLKCVVMDSGRIIYWGIDGVDNNVRNDLFTFSLKYGGI